MRAVSVAIVLLGFGLTPVGGEARADGGECSAGSGIVWEHVGPDDRADLMVLSCEGEVRQLTRTPPGSGGSELPRWGRRAVVYFDSDRAGLIHLFRLNSSDGRDVEQVTATDGLEFAPDPTPDGRRLVFEHAAADGSADGLFVAPNRVGVTEGSFRRLTASPAAAAGGFDTDPDVSPDGRSVAFTRVLDATPGAARSAVFTVGVDGRGLRQLTPFSMNAIDPRWSPDGMWLAFSSNGDNFSSTVSSDIYLMRADGSGLTQLTHERGGRQSFTPAWSPNGHRIVFAHAAPGLPGVQLQTMGPDGTHRDVVYQGRGGSEVRPDWRQPALDAGSVAPRQRWAPRPRQRTPEPEEPDDA